MLVTLLLLACDGDKSAPDDSAASDDSATTDDSAVEGSVYSASLSALGLCDADDAQPPPAPGPFTSGGASTFGTGLINSAVLGALQDDSVVVEAPARGSVDYSLDLDVEGYDLYIPPDYDGSEPYGLAVYVNAGDDGSPPQPWLSVLDAQRLIWVGGERIGNSVNVDVRMGKAALGAYRALELFNVDRSRVYATGTSGGARTAMVMSLLHPSLFPAAFPLCGASWFEQVEQAYETREPDSHYEFWGSGYFPDVDGQPFADWVLAYDQRFALLTSFDDFREGDLFNIYHFGLEGRGLRARLLEGEGGHCATTDAHARDALAYIESPQLIGVTENTPWLDASAPGASLAAAEGLQLQPAEGAVAAALAKGRVRWGDDAGATLRLTFTPEAGAAFTVQLASVEAGSTPAELLSQAAGLRVRVEGDTLTVSQSGAEGPTALATLRFTDWDGASALSLKLHLWSQELRLEPGAHLEVVELAEGAALLHDQRSVRLRFSELGVSWPEGAGAEDLLLISAEGGAVSVSAVEARDGLGVSCE